MTCIIGIIQMGLSILTLAVHALAFMCMTPSLSLKRAMFGRRLIRKLEAFKPTPSISYAAIIQCMLYDVMHLMLQHYCRSCAPALCKSFQGVRKVPMKVTGF